MKNGEDWYFPGVNDYFLLLKYCSEWPGCLRCRPLISSFQVPTIAEKAWEVQGALCKRESAGLGEVRAASAGRPRRVWERVALYRYSPGAQGWCFPIYCGSHGSSHPMWSHLSQLPGVPNLGPPWTAPGSVTVQEGRYNLLMTEIWFVSGDISASSAADFCFLKQQTSGEGWVGVFVSKYVLSLCFLCLCRIRLFMLVEDIVISWADGEAHLEGRITAIPSTHSADSPFQAWCIGLSLDPREALRFGCFRTSKYVIKPQPDSRLNSILIRAGAREMLNLNLFISLWCW